MVASEKFLGIGRKPAVAGRFMVDRFYAVNDGLRTVIDTANSLYENALLLNKLGAGWAGYQGVILNEEKFAGYSLRKQQTAPLPPVNKTYTLGSLFSGIGGIDLAFERAGFQIAFQVEIDDYCNRILERHWPHVERRRDVRECSAGNLPAVDVLVGGFPCQDISAAGKGAGIKEGNRSGLWIEFARIIGEIRPRIVLLENVAAITSNGGTRVIADLAALGYDAEWGVVPASAVGAPHRRERWWCVAHARRERWEPGQRRSVSAAATGDVSHNGPTDSNPTLAHTERISAELRYGLGAPPIKTKDDGSSIANRSTSMGNTASQGLSQPRQSQFATLDTQAAAGLVIQSERSSDELGNSNRISLKGDRSARQQITSARSRQGQPEGPGSDIAITGPTQSVMGRTVDGLSRQLDSHRWPARPNEDQYPWEAPRTITQKLAGRSSRLKALGNAVVPQVVQPIAEAIHALLEETDRAGSGIVVRKAR